MRILSNRYKMKQLLMIDGHNIKRLRLLSHNEETKQMNLPALYHKSHRAAKQDVGDIIKENSSKWQWRPDGGDTLIDVGSGPGDVLMDHIYPLMPSNFAKVMCTDISADMVEYAKSYYQSSEKCEFQILDIAAKTGLPSALEGKFDHVTSMLCLHWVQDHRTALKNIFNLLRPEGGDCLLVFMSSHTIFDAYHYTSRHTKWGEYMKDVDRFISPLHDSKDSIGDFTTMMEEAGFCEISVNIKPKTFSYGSVENFKENVKSICGILDDIPISYQSDFLDDFVAVMSEYAAQSGDLNPMQSKCTLKYDLIVAYGQKPPMQDDSVGDK